MWKFITWTRLLALAFLVALLGSYSAALADIQTGSPDRAIQSAIWDSEIVDERGGGSASLDLDENGRPHIAYAAVLDENTFTTGLIYARYTGSAWVKTTADDDSRPDTTDIAVESPTEVHISYFDKRTKNLKYAHLVNSKWEIETVDGDLEAGKSSSIALLSNGNPRIAYWDYTAGGQAIKYARWNGTSWVLDTIAEVTCKAGALIPLLSLAIDSSNYLHLTYSDCEQDALIYATNDGSGWTQKKIAGGTLSGVDNSLAIDSTQNPRIAFHTRGVSYAVPLGTSWNIETVDPEVLAGLSTSLALDEDDRPYISYIKKNEDNQSEVVLAYRIDSAWHFETVATSAEGNNFLFAYVNLAVDESGTPHIVYNDLAQDDLVYVTGDLQIGLGPIFIPVTFKSP